MDSLFILNSNENIKYMTNEDACVCVSRNDDIILNVCTVSSHNSFTRRRRRRRPERDPERGAPFVYCFCAVSSFLLIEQ